MIQVKGILICKCDEGANVVRLVTGSRQPCDANIRLHYDASDV